MVLLGAQIGGQLFVQLKGKVVSGDVEPTLNHARDGLAAFMTEASSKRVGKVDRHDETRISVGRARCHCVAVSSGSWRPRYIFIFPNGYVGWVQIIFNDPAAPPLPIKDGGYIIEAPDSGLSRTSELRVHDFKRQDEFYYRLSPMTGTQELWKVPSEYVLPGDSHGGFGVMVTDTGGKGKGYSWFIFIGPPSIRSKVPLADWDKEVEAGGRFMGTRACPLLTHTRRPEECRAQI